MAEPVVTVNRHAAIRTCLVMGLDFGLTILFEQIGQPDEQGFIQNHAGFILIPYLLLDFQCLLIGYMGIINQ